MRTIVRGKNLEVPDLVRQYAERKFARLDRLFDDRTDAVVELSNEAHRSAADAHIADVTMVVDGRTIRSRAAGASYQAALDTVVDKVERQAIDYKEKPRLRARPADPAFRAFPPAAPGPPQRREPWPTPAATEAAERTRRHREQPSGVRRAAWPPAPRSSAG